MMHRAGPVSVWGPGRLRFRHSTLAYPETMRIRFFPVLFVLAGSVLSGCTQRSPLGEVGPALEPTRIVAGVTDRGAADMAPTIGPRAVEIEGLLVRATDSEWTVQMLRVMNRDGMNVRWNRETVVFPREALDPPSRVEIHRTRSVLFGVAIVGGGFLLGRVFLSILATDAEGRGPTLPPIELQPGSPGG
jgi:hypothetical protein